MAGRPASAPFNSVGEEGRAAGYCHLRKCPGRTHSRRVSPRDFSRAPEIQSIRSLMRFTSCAASRVCQEKNAGLGAPECRKFRQNEAITVIPSIHAFSLSAHPRKHRAGSREMPCLIRASRFYSSFFIKKLFFPIVLC